jgi:hypothetical protein
MRDRAVWEPRVLVGRILDDIAAVFDDTEGGVNDSVLLGLLMDGLRFDEHHDQFAGIQMMPIAILAAMIISVKPRTAKKNNVGRYCSAREALARRGTQRCRATP